MKIKIVAIILFFTSVSYSAEEIRNGLVASSQGFVQVLNPIEGSQQTSGHKVIFENQKYWALKAKVGMFVKTNDMVMTGDDGKAKIILEHGDVLVVPSGSAISIPGPKKKEVHLIYGKIRAIIDKDGPLSGLQIKTPSVVAGVRGTDLFVSFDPNQNTTHVEVLRGEVKVEPVVAATQPQMSDKAIIVKTGEVGVMTMAKADLGSVRQDSVIHTEVRTSSVSDLKELKSDTTFDKTSSDISPQTKAEVEKAEAQAVENIIKDVKRYDQNAGVQLEKQKYASVEEVNSSLISKEASSDMKASLEKESSALLAEQIQNEIKISCGQNISSQEAAQYAATLFRSCTPGQQIVVRKGCETRCLKQVSGSIIGTYTR